MKTSHLIIAGVLLLWLLSRPPAAPAVTPPPPPVARLRVQGARILSESGAQLSLAAVSRLASGLASNGGRAEISLIAAQHGLVEELTALLTRMGVPYTLTQEA